MTLVALGCGGGNFDTAEEVTPLNRARILRGQVVSPDQVTLSPDAVCTVQLLNVARQDVAADVLAEQVLDPCGPFPIAFELTYVEGVIDQRLEYAVAARITEGDELRMLNTQRHPVLTREAPENDVLVAVTTIGNTPD